MWGEMAWGEADSQLMHTFPRALGAIEVLWANPADRTIDTPVVTRIENLACKLYQAGIKAGPLQPNVPCFGHPEF